MRDSDCGYFYVTEHKFIACFEYIPLHRGRSWVACQNHFGSHFVAIYIGGGVSSEAFEEATVVAMFVGDEYGVDVFDT